MSKKRKINIAITFEFKGADTHTFALSELTCEYKTKNNSIKSMTIPCDTQDQKQKTCTGRLHINTKAFIPANTLKAYELDRIMRITDVTLIDTNTKKEKTTTLPNSIIAVCFRTISTHIQKKFLNPKYKMNESKSLFDYELTNERFKISVCVKKNKYEIYYGSYDQTSSILKDIEIRMDCATKQHRHTDTSESE